MSKWSGSPSGPGGSRSCAQVAEPAAVARGDFPPPGDLAVVVFQIEVENRGLQIVQAGIQSPENDVAAGGVAAVIAEEQELLVDRVVVGHGAAAVAEAAERLGGIEADRAGRRRTCRRSGL